MCGKLHYTVKTKHRLHQYHEERVQKIGYQGAIGISIERNGCAILIWVFWMPNTRILLINVPTKMRMSFTQN